MNIIAIPSNITTHIMKSILVHLALGEEFLQELKRGDRLPFSLAVFLTSNSPHPHCHVALAVGGELEVFGSDKFSNVLGLKTACTFIGVTGSIKKNPAGNEICVESKDLINLTKILPQSQTEINSPDLVADILRAIFTQQTILSSNNGYPGQALLKLLPPVLSSPPSSAVICCDWEIEL